MSKIRRIDCEHGKSDNCDGCSIYEFAESKAKENVVSKPDPSSESLKYNELGKYLSKGIEIGMNEVISEGRKIELNQSVKADAGKPKLSLVPPQIIRDIAVIREYGNNKYPEGGKDNWKLVEPERYRDALFRHLLLYLEDPYGVDEESGLKHLAHVACNAAFLCELEKEKTNDK